MELKEKVAIVTGGGMGIGQAVALGLAREGAHVIILDINVEAANETAGQIEELGCKTLICETDVSDQVAVDKAVDQAMHDFGRIDILINNAGINHPSVSILDLDLDWLEKITNVDFKGVYYCSRRVGREMVGRRSGCVVNLSSIGGLTSLPLPVYGPIKSALVMFTQILARDWAKHGVRVNAVAPGIVMTPLLQDAFQKGWRDPDKFLTYVPMKQFIMPSDVAHAIVFLCSDKARFITGVTLPVDAGFLSEGGWSAYV